MFKERQIKVRFDGPTLAQIHEIEQMSGKSTLAILRESVNFSNWLLRKQTGARLMLRVEPHDALPYEVELKR